MTQSDLENDAALVDLPDYVEDVLSLKTTEYCVVIPVINEGDRIQAQLKRMQAAATQADVIVVDGGSTDGSVELDFLRSVGVRARLTKTGPGRLSAQLRIAYHWAMQQGYLGVVTIDGNGKDGVEALDAMCHKLAEGYDFVQGSRYARHGEAVNTPFARWFVGRFLFAPLTSLAGGYWYSEMTNGFRAYSRRFLMDPCVSPFRGLFNNYNLLFYLSVRAPQLGYRVTELGVRRGYPDNGKVPTKISGLAGQVALTFELLRTVMGAFHPGNPGIGVGLANRAGLSAIGLSLLAVLIFAVIAVFAVAQGIDPYVDEAMLAANYLVIGPADALTPLPFYQQAAPVGYSALAATIVQMTGSVIDPLRWLGLAAALLGAWLFYRALRRLEGGELAPTALGLMLLSPLLLAYAIGVKHYVFEVLTTALSLFGAAYALSRFDTRGFLVFAACLAATAILAIPAMLIIGAVGGGMILHIVTRAPSPAQAAALRAAVLAVIAASGFAMVWHLGVNEPIIRLQFTAFAGVYDNPGPTLFPLDLGPFKRLAQMLIGAFWPFGRPASMLLELLGFGVILTGVLMSLRYQPFLALSFLTFCILLVLLTLVGALPRLEDRQLLFMMPITSILWALGFMTLFRWVLCWLPSVAGRQVMRSGLVATCVVLGVGTVFAVRAVPSFERQQLTPLIQEIEQSDVAAAPVFVFISAQPGLAVIPHNLRSLVGSVDPTSTETGWSSPHRVYRPRPGGGRDRVLTESYLEHAAREMVDHEAMWLIATHLRSGPDLAPLITLSTRLVGPCKERRRAKDSILYLCGE